MTDNFGPQGIYNLNDASHWQWHLTFAGLFMQHNYRLYWVLDNVFEKVKPSSIVEIGTAYGALATYLGLWGLKLSIPVISFDIVDKHEHLPEKLGVKYCQEDVFTKETIHKILKYIGDKPTLFICDGGDKQREFLQFVPLLPKGSVIMVHDFGQEFFLENVEKVMPLVEPFLKERWDEMNCQAVFFQKI